MPNNDNKKILIIEDGEFFRRLYKEGLGAAGFRVLQANDGQEGIEKIKAKKPDLVLLDLLMPNQGGYAVLEEVASNEDTKNIPIIVLSNLNQDSDIKKSKELGAVDYLIKANVTLKDVIGRIRFHLAED